MEHVCTTRQAAEMLGVSISTVQGMVEAGQLEAWKTAGGHRRIHRSSVEALKSQALAPPERPPRAVEGRPFRVLVVEDDEIMRRIVELQLKRWALPLEVTCCGNGYQALMRIASDPPDLVLADLLMSGIDGFEVLATILGKNDLAAVRIAILSGISEEELAAHGGLPPQVALFRKPVNFDELRGFVRGCMIDVERCQQG